jgi:hypothetical protein
MLAGKNVYSSITKSIPIILLCGCSDYELTAVNEKTAPMEDTAIVMDIPVAVAGPSQRVKKNIPMQLDGSGSYHPTNPAILLNYEWVLTSYVEDANIAFQDTQSSAPTFLADKVGSYVAELQVTDSFDAPSENFAATVIEVIPYENLFITLSWDTPNIDLDLHLLSNPAGYYSTEDCFFGNPTPDWGELNNHSDDPVLVFDDEGNEQTERIEFRRPQEGMYDILVHYYNIPVLSNVLFTLPTIRIEAEGQIIYEAEGPRLTGPGQIWKVGIFDWQSFVFIPDGTITDHGVLGGPIYND